MVQKLQNFTLVKEEASGLLEEGDISISQDECGRCLIGRIFGDNIANFTSLRNALDKIWNTVKPFKSRELSTNLYQFVFELEEDKQRIFNGRPWVFDGQCIILKQWKENMNPLTESFQSSLLWIRV